LPPEEGGGKKRKSGLLDGIDEENGASKVARRLDFV
jgi:hypothetical protein